MTQQTPDTKQKEAKCLFILAENGKWGVKDHLKPFGAVYNGVGWFIEEKFRNEAEQICQQADMKLFEWPLVNESFADLKRSHNLSFFQQKSIKLQLHIEAIKVKLGITSIDLSDLLKGEDRINLEAIPEGKKLIDAASELDRLQEQIKRIEEERRIANITVKGEGGFGYLLKNCSEQQVIDEIKRTSPGTRVGYKIGDVDLKMPGGALSIVAAPTGHGKTATLINFSLGALKHNHDLSVCFFSYEENASSILTLFLNTYIDTALSKNNRESIKSYFRNANPQFIKDTEQESFERSKSYFFEHMVDTGRLKVFYSEMSANELVGAIRFLKANTNIGMVCIDYMQLLKMLNGPQSRQEQLKEICLMLKDCAVDTGLPIVLGAQFNRTVTTQADLSATAIGEAGDIERVSNLLIGLWNRNYEGLGREKNVDKAGKQVPKEPTIYFEILKGREIGHGHSSVLPFDGNTGKLSTEAKPSSSKQEPKASHTY